MTSKIYVCQLTSKQQKLIRNKLAKIVEVIYGGMEYIGEPNIIEETIQKGMDGKLCDLEEVIDVPLFIKTGKVKGNKYNY